MFADDGKHEKPTGKRICLPEYGGEAVLWCHDRLIVQAVW